MALQLLVGYLASALDIGALVTPELEQLAATHVYDLLAVALGATRDTAEVAKGRGIRAARLRAIKTDILAHLGQQGLSLDAVAVRHAISPVYIRKLFASEGSSFSQFVLEQRLERAQRRQLTGLWHQRAGCTCGSRPDLAAAWPLWRLRTIQVGP